MKWNVGVKGGPCRSCGAPSTELHHAIPRSIGTRETKRDLRNGLPLCSGCHWRWHQGHPIRREAFEEDEWNFLEKVTLTGMETQWYLDKHYPPAKVIAESMLEHA